MLGLALGALAAWMGFDHQQTMANKHDIVQIKQVSAQQQVDINRMQKQLFPHDDIP